MMEYSAGSGLEVAAPARRGSPVKRPPFSLVLRHRFFAFFAVIAIALGTTALPFATTIASASSPTINLSQCANGSGAGPTCNWISTPLLPTNSQYNMGDTIPQRIEANGFAPGSTHTLTLQYDSTNAGKHAYDYLSTWDASENWITTANQCLGISGCAAATESTSPIPQDPNVPSAYETPGGQFVIRGATITSSTTPTIASGAYGGNSATQETLTFTVDNSGPMCTTTCDVVLWFGSHVATNNNWGSGTVAVGNSGMPFDDAVTSLDGSAVTGVDDDMSNLVQTSALSIVKTASPTNFTAANQVITYSYLVTNTGNDLLNPVVVTDAMPTLSAMSCPSTSLAAGANETCHATYTTTSADVTAGKIVNTAVVTGTPLSGPSVSATATVTVSVSPVVPVVQSPAISIVKTASPSSFTSAGTPITYSYLVTNTGNEPLTSMSVTDAMPGLSHVTCPSLTLAAGANETCQATYTTTAADVTAGKIVNTAVVTGTPPSGPAISATATLSLSTTVSALTQNSGLTVVKSASPTNFTASGSLITYSYLVTNTGNDSLTGVSVTDAMSGLSAITCPSTTLAAGAKETCQATYTTTAADVTAGDITNIAVASGTPPSGPAVSATATVTLSLLPVVPLVQAPAISIVKSANLANFTAAGQAITYNYLVTNSGNVSLTPVSVTDAMTGLSAVTCPSTTLAAGANETCHASYTTTAADVTARTIVNTAVVTAPGVSATATLGISLSGTVPVIQSPALSIVKSSSVANFTTSGTPITFSFLVTNTGNVTLAPVTVTDSMSGLSAITCPSTTLAAGANETCHANYTTTAADVAAGVITNIAVASGTPPTGPAVSATATVSVSLSSVVPVAQSPALTIVKTASPTNFTTAGTSITYSYLVTNTGNVALAPVVVSDAMPRLSAMSCPSTTLAVGANETCHATYTTTSADVTAGKIVNTAVVTGTPPSGPAVSTSTTITLALAPAVPVVQSPALSLVKTASLANFTAAGTLVTYNYLLTNTGNVALTTLSVTDAMPGLSVITCPSTTLAVGANETCHATYTTTSADVTAGAITNVAVATGVPPVGPTVTTATTITLSLAPSVPVVQSPALSIVKSSSVSNFSAAGTLITYSYLVTNTGNVTLNPVVVSDAMTGLSAMSCPATTLAAGANETCHATYTTTAADVTAGTIVNTAIATGTPPSGPAVSASSTLFLSMSQSPSLSIVKSANASNFTSAGTLITYNYLVTNTGDVTLSPVSVTDPMVGLSAISCPTTTLAVGANETCHATYTTTAADVSAGAITNTAVATGTPPSGPTVNATSTLRVSTVAVPFIQSPAINVVKSANLANFTSAGTLITYSYLVINTGNVQLSPVSVTDPMVGLSAISCPTTTLAAGANETCDATYTTTAADVAAGVITNTAVATGTPPSGPTVSATSTLRVSTVAVPFVQGPAINIVKTASLANFTSAGTLITFNFLVTNVGNVTLSPVSVTDPMVGLSAITCPTTVLAAGANETCHATYTTTATDMSAGVITNTAVAAGVSPSGVNVSSSSTVHLSTGLSTGQAPALTIAKSANVANFTSAGTLITYSYLVTNTGNVTLSPVSVTDAMPGLSAITCPTTVLAAGANETCHATYTTTSADISAGAITNNATATGTPPSGSNVSATATLSIPAVVTVVTPPPTNSGPPPVRIPTSAPSTGLGGAARVKSHDLFLGLGIVSLLGGLAVAEVGRRKRRA